MSLQDRISAQSKLDTDLMVQNNRIGRSARKQENTVLPFNPVDEELLREYNQQFLTGFEYTDKDTGEKKFRKYMLPQDAPELDEPELEEVKSDAEVEAILQEEQKLVEKVEKVKLALEETQEAIALLKNELNAGLKTKVDYRTQDKAQQKLLKKLQTQLQILEDEIPRFNNFKEEYARRTSENKARISITAKSNKEKIAKYKEELNILNSKAFTTEQLPSETEGDYFERLKYNAEFTEPEENLENAKQLTLNRFKTSLKELVRDSSKLEQISNTIDKFGEVGNKLKLLKKWNLFKVKYIKVFGANNPNITVDDIVEFMKEFLSDGGESITPVSEKVYEKNDISELTKALMFKYKTNDEIKTRLREYNRDNRNLDTDYFDKIKSGKDARRDNIAKQVARQIIIRGKTNDEVGFGIETEKIPEKVNFGKLVLLLQKLYYKNILAVKHHNMISIAGLKNTKVSEKFVKIVMGMVEGIHPTTTEINGLSVAEKQLYDRLIHLAGLNKMIPHTQDKTVTDLKKRMKLIEAEISAGNNSPILLQELYVIVHSLKDFGILSQKDIKTYLSQF